MLKIGVLGERSAFPSQFFAALTQSLLAFGLAYQLHDNHSFEEEEKVGSEVDLLLLPKTGTGAPFLTRPIKQQPSPAFLWLKDRHHDWGSSLRMRQKGIFILPPSSWNWHLRPQLRQALLYLSGQPNFSWYFTHRGWLTFTLSDIVYIMSDSPRVYVYWQDQTVHYFYGQLAHFLKVVGNVLFFQCHGSYLVNKTYMVGFDQHDVILRSGQRLPISRRYRSVLEDWWPKEAR